MADNTKIEWTDATVNAVNGCSLVSPGCTNCYAMRLAGTRMKHHPSRAGLTTESKAGPVWTGEVRLSETALLQPLLWKRPRRIFWNAHGDLFHPSVPDEWIDRVFAVCALTPQHSHQILTKRSARMRDWFEGKLRSHEVWRAMYGLAKTPGAGRVLDSWYGGPSPAQWPLPNVWLGVSVEDQTRADERIPDLLATPAAVHFLSCEPLLGPISLNHVLPSGAGSLAFRSARPDEAAKLDEQGSWAASNHWLAHLNWVIVGGESGPGARPMHPDWARSIRDQCAFARLPFHFKQWGEWVPSDHRSSATGPGFEHWHMTHQGDTGFLPQKQLMSRVGKRAAGRLLDGIAHDGMPA